MRRKKRRPHEVADRDGNDVGAGQGRPGVGEGRSFTAAFGGSMDPPTS